MQPFKLPTGQIIFRNIGANDRAGNQPRFPQSTPSRGINLPNEFHRRLGGPGAGFNKDSLPYTGARLGNATLSCQASFHASQWQQANFRPNNATSTYNGRVFFTNLLGNRVQSTHDLDLMMQNALSNQYLPEYIINYHEDLKNLATSTRSGGIEGGINTLLFATLKAFNITNYQTTAIPIRNGDEISIYLPACLRARIADNYLLRSRPRSSQYCIRGAESGTSKFLTLPGEIRNRIYTMLLSSIGSSTTNISRPPNMGDLPSIKLIATTRSARDLTAVKALILTCRQTNQEMCRLYGEIPKTYSIAAFPSLLDLPTDISHLEISFTSDNLTTATSSVLGAILFTHTALAKFPNLTTLTLVRSPPDSRFRPLDGVDDALPWICSYLFPYGRYTPHNPAAAPYFDHFFFWLGLQLQAKAPAFRLLGGCFERTGMEGSREVALMVVLQRE